MSKNNKGFTLMEMLIVVLIIGVLGAIAFPQYSSTLDRTRIAANLSLLQPLAQGAIQYYNLTDTAPDKLTKLPVGIPQEWAQGDTGLSAISPDGNCTITLNVEGENSSAKPSSMTMACKRGSADDYTLEFTYGTNSSGMLYISEHFITVTASDADRQNSLNRAIKASGWNDCEGSKCKIN